MSLAYNLSVVLFAWLRYIGYWLWAGHYYSYLWLCKTCSFSSWWWFIRRKSFLHSKNCFFFHPLRMMANLSIIVVICFLVICSLLYLLTRYWFVSCQQHMCQRFYLLCIYAVLADFELVMVPVLLYLALFVNLTLICSMSAAFVHWGYPAIQFSFNECYSEQVTVSISVLFTWDLCIYIILDEGYNILFVFGLNSNVCSHIACVRLSSEQVTYYLFFTCHLIVFYCICVLEFSSNLQCVLVRDAIF